MQTYFIEWLDTNGGGFQGALVVAPDPDSAEELTYAAGRVRGTETTVFRNITERGAQIWMLGGTEMSRHQPDHPAAIAAIRAAAHYRQWGSWAARRYAQKRGAPAALVTLARVLAAAERAGLT